MPEKEWVKAFGHFALLVRRFTKGGVVTKFAVVLFAFHEGEWIDITRYDTAHGFAHRDVQGRKEGLRGKLRLPMMSYNEAFDYAIRDLTENAETYLADFNTH